MLMVVDHMPFYWIYVCETVLHRDVSVCLWQFNIHYASDSIFSGANLRDYISLLIRITNRWYLRNHFIPNVLKKTKLFSFNTVTFFLAVSNLLPRGPREPQLPPSPRKLLTAISPEPGALGSHYLHSTEIQSHPFHTPNITRTLRIWPVFVPIWSVRGRAGKKVTAVTFFRCPTVIIYFLVEVTKKDSIKHMVSTSRLEMAFYTDSRAKKENFTFPHMKNLYFTYLNNLLSPQVNHVCVCDGGWWCWCVCVCVSLGMDK